MDIKAVVFNATVCIIGFMLLTIHSIGIALKKNRRRDENILFVFIVFTAIHFALYSLFTFLKLKYKNDAMIMGFYTTFYIMNNVQLLLFFLYAISYIKLGKKIKDITTIINLSVFGIYVILDLINIFTHMFFSASGGKYERANTMVFAQGYQLVAFVSVFFLSISSKKLRITEKIAFTVYCVIPLVSIVLQILFSGYAIAYLALIISIEVVFSFINSQKNILLAQEEKERKEAEVKIMMSQIQPHFIYNTLASISTLIPMDPQKAQEGLDDFTEYLRANLSALSQTRLINFTEELKHVETYLSLEKMRFEDRLNVVYDIKAKDFLVPPLSIQPIVENAVKHGILKKIEGGTVTIKSYETQDACVVEIVDDGIGFFVDKVNDDNKNHVGINNVRYRISSMCDGKMEIKSEIDVGTTVVVTFSK